MFIATLLTIARIWNQPKCLSAEWQLNKVWFLKTVIDDGMEFCAVIRKKEERSWAGIWLSG